MLAFEGSSEVVWFEANYQAFIEDLEKAQRAPDADQTHRDARKRLIRA